MVYKDHSLRLAPDHLARMQQAAWALCLELPTVFSSAQALASTLEKLVVANSFNSARIRLQLWRAGGGLYTPLTDTCDWLATAEPYVANNSTVQTADFALETHSIYSPLSFCKGPQAWLYVRAAHERQRRGLDEIILCNGAGHVAEAGAAAIFWMKDGVLFTPSLASGCVSGVRRAQVLRAAQAAGLECREGLFKQEALLAADAAFTANVVGIRTIQQVGSVKLSSSIPFFIKAV